MLDIEKPRGGRPEICHRDFLPVLDASINFEYWSLLKICANSWFVLKVSCPETDCERYTVLKPPTKAKAICEDADEGPQALQSKDPHISSVYDKWCNLRCDTGWYRLLDILLAGCLGRWGSYNSKLDFELHAQHNASTPKPSVTSIRRLRWGLSALTWANLYDLQ